MTRPSPFQFRIAALAAALALALPAAAAIPTTAEGWYTPAGGYKTENMSASWRQGDEGGTCTVGYDEYDNPTVYWGGNPPRDNATKAAFEYALEALLASEMTRESIETLGKNLNALGKSSGIEVTTTDPNGGKHTYTLSFGGGTLQQTVNSGDKISVTDPSRSYNHADERTLHWNAANKVELLGSATASSSASHWWDDWGFAVPCIVGSGSLSWRKFGGFDDAVFKATEVDGRKILALNGWYGDSNECGTTLSDILTGDDATNRERHWVLTRYTDGTSGVKFHYVPFGDRLESGGAPVDDASITTNRTDGATAQGVASLFNWSPQPDYAIPYKYSGKLFWRTPDQWADGASLEWRTDGAGNSRLSVAGAANYAGLHARHYFGTSNDKSAALGWHELPNVTTNVVRGDEITIASNPAVPGYTPPADGSEKILGLRGWNYSWQGDPLFVVNSGGGIGYIPLPALTNLAACACTGKWDSATAWIGGDAKVADDGGLSLPGSSLDNYLSQSLGYLYSTTPANLYFDNDAEDGKITASFDAPSNWADGKSLDLTADGKYQVKGFASASACSAPLSAMLSNPKGGDATTHLILAKKTDTGELHYVPLGDGVKSGFAADETTITTNTTDGAASIVGFDGAEDGTTPVRRGNTLAWEAPAAVLSVVGDYDDTEVVCTNKLILKGSGIEFRVEESDGGSVTVTAYSRAGNFNYNPITHEISYGYAIVARTPVQVDGHTVSAAGYVYLSVDHSSSSPTETIVSGVLNFPSPTDTTTIIPLYYIGTDLSVTHDFRGAPQIQVME